MTQSQFTPAYMGEFLKTYKPPLINKNILLNILTTPQRTVFVPSAIITREVQFPDVSFYQGEIDYSIMCIHTDAIIIRAGQNVWVDVQFEFNYAEARACGLKIGVYWFYDDRVSPGNQAQILLSLLKQKTIDLEVFIDWENTYGGRYKGLQNVVAMMQVVENAGYKVGLYTGYFWFRANSNAITNANQYNYLKNKPLWLAWYTSNPANVLIPAPWTKLTHWQFGTPVVFWGQETSELDMNFFNGSVQEFNETYGGSIPPDGGDMAYRFEIKPDTSIGSKIRSDHSVSAGQIGALSFGKRGFGNVRWGDGVQEDWIQIVEYENNQGGRTFLSGWIASRSAGNKVATITENPVEPPPDPDPQPTLKHTILVDSEGNLTIDGIPYS